MSAPLAHRDAPLAAVLDEAEPEGIVLDIQVKLAARVPQCGPVVHGAVLAQTEPLTEDAVAYGSPAPLEGCVGLAGKALSPMGRLARRVVAVDTDERILMHLRDIAVAEEVRNEFCLKVTGLVRARPEGTHNANLTSGKVEYLSQPSARG